MPTELLKTLSYLSIHLTVGFSVAYLLTGSVEVAGGIALIEPCVNAVAFSSTSAPGRAACGRAVRRLRPRGCPSAKKG